MAINKPFTVKNGLTVGAVAVIDGSGNWIGPSTNLLGATGPAGPQGPQGASGDSGTPGPPGANGPIGSQGPQGSEGPTPTGAPGVPGVSGPQGPAGPIGPDGPQGANGPRGPQGPQGAQGAIGQTGDSGGGGPQGARGPQGPQGVVGGTGPQGAQGVSGAQGPQGVSNTLQSQVSKLGVGTPAGSTVGEIRATNNITAFYSDIRLKDNIVAIEDSSYILDRLRGVYFTQNSLAEYFNYHNYSKQIGVIAQEVQAVLPEAVKMAPFDTGADDLSRTGENYLTVNYVKILPVLIEVIKQHQKEINILKERIV